MLIACVRMHGTIILHGPDYLSGTSEAKYPNAIVILLLNCLVLLHFQTVSECTCSDTVSFSAYAQ